ncbi:MAG: hypothetical protein KDC54_11180, partial [Lewinella sp.]|nr:hypothetical protein [Lewinella sp.]
RSMSSQSFHPPVRTLLRLARNSEGEMTKSIGLGLAIPDGLTDGFYYYISPWQSSGEVDIRDLPPLPAGEWRTGDWTGAILPLSTLAERSSSGEQKELLGAFADQALATWIERLQG